MANVGTHYVARDFFAFESVTVTGTAGGLTAATYAPGTTVTPASPASFALITIEADQIRWRADGGTATSASHLMQVGDTIELQGTNAVVNFSAIRVSGNATIRVSYAR